jgi:hypothetical protein
VGAEGGYGLGEEPAGLVRHRQQVRSLIRSYTLSGSGGGGLGEGKKGTNPLALFLYTGVGRIHLRSPPRESG